MHKVQIETLVSRKNSQFHSYIPDLEFDLDDKDCVFTAGAMWNAWQDALKDFVSKNPGDGTRTDDIQAEVIIHGVDKESPKYIIDEVKQFVSSLIAKGYLLKKYGGNEFLLPAVYIGLSYSGSSIDAVYTVWPWSLDNKALFEAINDSCITSVPKNWVHEIDWLWGRYNRAFEYDYDYETIADKVVSMIKKEINVND